MVVDDFIGQRFGEEGHLEVVGCNGLTSTKKRYIVKCYVCAEDSELFGDGKFETLKGDLISGQIPCGCSKSARMTQEQYIIKIRRKCVGKLDFLGFVGKYKASSTNLKLRCNKHGITWETTDIYHLLAKDRVVGCPKCVVEERAKNSTKPDSDMIKSFMDTGKYPIGSEFWRSSRKDRRGHQAYWHFRCPVCSADEYTKVGLCSGVFETTTQAFQAGKIPCRCSKAVRWEKSHVEYDLRKAISKFPQETKLVGWANEKFLKSSSKVHLECAEHGEWITMPNNILVIGTGCPSCAKSGYDKTKQGFVYVMRVSGESGNFTGYGITNSIDKRIQTHKRNLVNKNFNIAEMKVFCTTGEKAVDIENQIKYNFNINSQDIEGFIREAASESDYVKIVSFIEKLMQEDLKECKEF